MKTTVNRHLVTPVLATAVALFLTAPAEAQNAGGLSAQMLQQLEQQHQAHPASRALQNAVAANAIDGLAANRANAGDLDTYFSVETPSQTITDQKQSGRCWMFSGFNVLRGNFAKRTDSLTVSLSQSYLFFYDQLEKSNLMLQGVIDTAKKPFEDQRVQFFFRSPIGDGGTFCGVADLAEKYGLVPSNVQPESFSAESTSRMAAILKSKLREHGLKLRQMVADGRKTAEVQKAKTAALAEVYNILALTLGEPVKTFDYAFRNKDGRAQTPVKQYTPKTFYDEVVGGPINGTFIMVMNDPRRPYYKTYEVEYDRHTYDGHNWKYLNLPMDDIEQLAIASLKDGHKLYSSYDVAKQLDRKRGFADTGNFDYAALFGTSFTMDKAQRIATFDSGSTHAMTLTAVDLDAEGKPVKWKVENSWGSSWGQKGCLIMTGRWFREYMFRLVVDKKYVSPELLEAYGQKPVMVMPEDPLFQEDK